MNPGPLHKVTELLRLGLNFQSHCLSTPGCWSISLCDHTQPPSKLLNNCNLQHSLPSGRCQLSLGVSAAEVERPCLGVCGCWLTGVSDTPRKPFLQVWVLCFTLSSLRLSPFSRGSSSLGMGSTAALCDLAVYIRGQNSVAAPHRAH